MTVTTWCGGTGAAWAERRTNISCHGELLVEAVALWVPVDPTGHPVRVKPAFFDVYGEAMQGRKVSGRIASPVVAEDAQVRAWPLRRADLDIVGHVNNAAVWQAVTEVVTSAVSSVSVVHHGAVESGHDVQIAYVPGSLWMLVDGEVRVSAEYAE
jgi:acyl-ACP thioesterase